MLNETKTTLLISLFGLPIFRTKEEEIKLSRKKAMAIAAYLCVQRESHSRSRLASMFWPDLEESKSKAALRQNIALLKKSALGNFFQIDNQSMQFLAGDSVAIDVVDFQNSMIDFESRYKDQDISCDQSAIALLEKALTLYSSDFLTGFMLGDTLDFDDWQFFQAEKYNKMAQFMMRTLMQIYRQNDNLDKAIRLGHKWLAIAPLEEKAYRTLMVLFYLSGQRNEALHYYKKCEHVLRQELDIKPAKDTIQLYQDIRCGQVQTQIDSIIKSKTVEKRTSKLDIPKPVSPFYGRKKEMNVIYEQLENPDCRLLTILGSGGIGKTRLALEIARTVESLYLDGIFFLSMLEIHSQKMIYHALAYIIDYDFDSSTDLARQLSAYLRNKKVLLILDDFEHLAEQCTVLDEILKFSSALTIIVTSRVRLRLHDEWCIDLRGFILPQPSPEKELLQNAAVQLFLHAGKKVKNDFAVTEDNSHYIIEICNLLDGIPLAIELAGSLLRILSCQEIFNEIKHDITILQSNYNDIPERHRSIQAIYDYSFNLLSEKEQTIFMQCAVFSSGMQRQAIEYVCKAGMKDLIQLVDKSLVLCHDCGRYQIHELIKQYSIDKLKNNALLYEETKTKHMKYYFCFLRSVLKDEMAEIPELMSQSLHKERKNILDAWEWAVEKKKFSFIKENIKPLFNFFNYKGLFEEGKTTFEKTMNCLLPASNSPDISDDELRGRLFFYIGLFQEHLGRFNESVVNFYSSQEYFIKAAKFEEAIIAGKKLAFTLLDVGEVDKAESVIRETLTLSEQHNYIQYQPLILCSSAYIEAKKGNIDNVEAILEKSLKISEQHANHNFTLYCNKSLLAALYMYTKEYGKAQKVIEEGLKARLDNLRNNQYGDITGLNCNAKYCLSFFITKLGKLSIKKSEEDAAFSYFAQTLQLGLDINSLPICLEGIIGIANYYVIKKEYHKSFPLLYFVVNNPAAVSMNKCMARKLLSEVKPQLTDAQLQKSKEEAMKMDWHELVTELINECHNISGVTKDLIHKETNS